MESMRLVIVEDDIAISTLLGDVFTQRGDAIVSTETARTLGFSYPPTPNTEPTILPTPAVTPIASIPQKLMRHAPRTIFAPPAYAAKPPSSVSKISEVAATSTINISVGARATTSSGNAAPAKKLSPEANAACNGRALSVSVIPNSSRAWASNAL